MSDNKNIPALESSSETDQTEHASPSRRRLLQATSMSGIALLISACSRPESKGGDPGILSDDQFCGVPGEPSNPSQQDIQDIADELWGAFDRGTLTYTKTGVMPLAAGVKDDRQAYHSVVVKQNWSKMSRCRRLTRQCAFNAGVVSAAMATAAGKTAISKETFVAAAAAVFEMQRYRAGGEPTFSGIAC